MKCLLFLLFFFLAQAQATLYSQQVKVSIEKQNVSLEEVLEELQRQTRLDFLYNSRLIQTKGNVTIHATDKGLNELLSELLPGLNLEFIVRENVVIIRDKPTNLPQQRRIQGTVKDGEGYALPGATVLVKNTLIGTIADANGFFTLDLPEGDQITIVITFIGKKPAEFKYTGQALESVVLQDAIVSVDEVMVTGYQTISKERATGSYGSLTQEQISRMTSFDLAQVLEGMIAGVVKAPNINSIKIRGDATLLISGQESPLFVIDGFPVEGELVTVSNNTVVYSMPNINPETIENITVLKDAAAASIYGAKAGNGVVVITTKKAKQGAAQISFSADIQLSPGIDYDYMKYRSASQYLDMQWDFLDKNPGMQDPAQRPGTINSLRNGWFLPAPSLEIMLKHYDGTYTKEQAEKQLEQYRSGGLPLLDDLKEHILRPSVTQRYFLSVGKATEGSSTMASITYTNNRGNHMNKLNESIDVNLRNSLRLAKWLSADLNAVINYGWSKSPEGFFELTSIAADGVYPYTRLVDAEGNPIHYYRSGIYPSNLTAYEQYAEHLLPLGYSPIEALDENFQRAKDFRSRLSATLNFRATNWLSFSSGFFFEHGQRESVVLYEKDSYTMRKIYDDNTYLDFVSGAIGHRIPYGDSQTISTNNTDNYTWRNQLNVNYTTKDGVHSFVALAGNEVREVSGRYAFNRLYGYDPKLLTWTTLNNKDLTNFSSSIIGTYAFMSELDFHSESETVNRFVSFYANAAYTLKNRYDISGSARWDKSNFFGTNPKYQNRPLWSVGAAWNMQEEDFLQKVQWLNRLKLRATYGIAGNIARDASPYLVASYTWLNNVTGNAYGEVSSPPNASLRWEKVRTTNMGVNFSVLDNRLFGAVDIYWKKSTDLMIDTEIEPTYGFSKLKLNAGDMTNRGIEISLNGTIFETDDWRWTAGFTYAHNKNEVTKSFVKPTYASTVVSSGTGTMYLMEGCPLYSMFSYRFKGINENGDPVVVDENGEEYWNRDMGSFDGLVYSGSLIPVFSGGLNTALNWKGVELNLHFVYNGGHKMRKPSADPHIYGQQGPATLMPDDYKNVWQQAGDENKPGVMPRLTYTYDLNTGYRNQYWKYGDDKVVSASYVKLRAMTLSYSMPRELLKKTFLKGVRLRAQVNDLFYISAYGHGIDPEAYYLAGGTRQTKNRPSYSFGLNVSF